MEKNIISKIEKLLALAGNNPSEAEAQAAMLKAQQGTPWSNSSPRTSSTPRAREPLARS